MIWALPKCADVMADATLIAPHTRTWAESMVLAATMINKVELLRTGELTDWAAFRPFYSAHPLDETVTSIVDTWIGTTLNEHASSHEP